MEAIASTHTQIHEIISTQEFQEAWDWLFDHISIEQSLIPEHSYYFDHKHWQYPDHIKCIDECDNSEVFLARLYLVSQLASVSDYLSNLKQHNLIFRLEYSGDQLDEDVARVINAEETAIHLNAFRNSLSEHLAYWALLASIIKSADYQDFSISKPNLQPEDKGPDGLACVVRDDFSIIKLVSVKNSINSPQELISSASFRNSSGIVLNEKKILDEFYAFQNHNRGFQRLDDKLNTLLQELHQDGEKQIRLVLLNNHSQFNAAVVADEKYAADTLFSGYNRISNKPLRCIGIYIGSGNWQILANKTQAKVKDILTARGISH
jgi:hypothetical protein